VHTRQSEDLYVCALTNKDQKSHEDLHT